MRGYFDGSELEEDNLKEALAKHAECWEDAELDFAIVEPAATQAATMEHESTTVGGVDAIRGCLERFFDFDNVRKAFRDTRESYRPGRAKVITKALVMGLHSRVSEAKVVSSILDMKGGWKNKSDNVLNVVREAAVDWKIVEQDDHFRSKNRSKANDKYTKRRLLE